MLELPVFDAEHVNLEDFRVDKAPDTIYLMPDFLNEEEEEYLIRKVNEAPKPRWTQLSNRRLQNWGGHPHAKGMIPESLPAWLQTYSNKIAKLGVFGDRAPNHVLINEYLPGQGIMPHVDGPVFFPTITTLNLGSHTVIDYYHASPATPSSDFPPDSIDSTFENVIVVDLDETASRTRYLQDRHAFSLFVPRRALLIQKDKMYTDYLHGIKQVKVDEVDEKVLNRGEVSGGIPRATRISLTIRLVQKTSKFKLNFSRN